MQTINLEQKTISILKSFSAINPSILIKPGKVVSTISPTKTIMAKANIDQEFETTFAIYDVSRFLSTLSLFDNPKLEINDKLVVISSGDKKMRYGFADPSAIISPPDKELKLPSVDITFKLTHSALTDVMKALAVLRLPEIAVVGDGEDINLQAIDSTGKTSDVYSISVGKSSEQFRMIFKAENIKVIPGDYEVEISKKGISHFKNDVAEYWIAVEANSNA